MTDTNLADFTSIDGYIEDPPGSGLYIPAPTSKPGTGTGTPTGPTSPPSSTSGGHLTSVSFQPYNADQRLYYPSGLDSIGGTLYSVDGLTKAADRLYTVRIGDYAHPVYDPIPHVELTVFDLDPDTVTITGYRRAENRTMQIRGAGNLAAIGGANIVDWDAPFGIPMTYYSEQFDVEGNSLGYTIETSTVLDVNESWVHDPLNPGGGTVVTMEKSAASTLPRETEANYYYPQGRGVAFGVFGQRSGLKDVPLNFMTRTNRDYDRVEAMFGDPYVTPSPPSIVCVRSGAGMNMHLPQPFYAGIANPVPTPFDTATGGETVVWVCTGTEVAPPVIALITPVLTRDELDEVYQTRAQRNAAYQTRLERDRDYSLATDQFGQVPPAPTDTLWGSGIYGAGIFGA